MRQIVHACIAGRVPDIQLKLLRAASVSYINPLAEVRDYVRCFLFSLAGALHERLYDASLANLRLTHEDNLRLL